MLRQHRGHSHALISRYFARGFEGEVHFEPGFEVSEEDCDSKSESFDSM